MSISAPNDVLPRAAKAAPLQARGEETKACALTIIAILLVLLSALSAFLLLLQSHCRQFLLQQGNTIVAPKHLAFDNKNRHAKDLIFVRLLLNRR